MRRLTGKVVLFGFLGAVVLIENGGFPCRGLRLNSGQSEAVAG